MPETRPSITILGDGGWGTAISTVLAEKGRSCVMWGHDPAYLEEMTETRENRQFLPGVKIPATVTFDPDLGRALADATFVIVAIPTQYLRASLEANPPQLAQGTGVVSLTKGIEQETLLRPSEIVGETLGAKRVAVLSGPSHAEEVARKLPTTVVVACHDQAFARTVQETLMTAALRVYTSTDVLGVELGGALKNVIALAGGISAGLELGDNALAALLTRGLAEITRLGVALGAEARTFSGLSGLGDLVVTAGSQHSRNRSVGVALGQGNKLADILAQRQTVAEGVSTAAAASALARKAGVEMPIVEQVVDVLYFDKDPRQAVADLMTREGKAE